MTTNYEKIKTFDRSKWIISENKETRYKNIRDNLKEMNVLKAFNQQEAQE